MDLKILSYSSTGIVDVLIDDKPYRYIIDGIYIPEFIRKAKSSSGAAINFLKEKSRHCKDL